jgi:hypothetical protein
VVFNEQAQRIEDRTGNPLLTSKSIANQNKVRNYRGRPLEGIAMNSSLLPQISPKPGGPPSHRTSRFFSRPHGTWSRVHDCGSAS